jgi:hypothetical protein
LKKAADLWAKKGGILKKIQKKIRGVHRDFRTDIVKNYSETVEKMKELFERFNAVAIH